jgi:hypothetical protein
MIRNSPSSFIYSTPLIVIVMEVVSSKGFGLMGSTLFVVGQKSQLKEKQN